MLYGFSGKPLASYFGAGFGVGLGVGFGVGLGVGTGVVTAASGLFCPATGVRDPVGVTVVVGAGIAASVFVVELVSSEGVLLVWGDVTFVWLHPAPDIMIRPAIVTE